MQAVNIHTLGQNPDTHNVKIIYGTVEIRWASLTAVVLAEEAESGSHFGSRRERRENRGRKRPTDY